MSQASGPSGGVSRARSRSFERLLATRAGALGSALVSFLVLAGLACLPRSFNVSGLLDFALARSVGHAPLATLLFPMAKPARVLLEALPAALGRRAFSVFGALAGAAAVYLTSEIARVLGLCHPNLAGWLVATGVALATGVLGGTAVTISSASVAAALLWYFSSRRGAAWLLGALPLVSPELGVVTLAMLAHELWARRRPRAVLGMLAPASAYVLAQTLSRHGVRSLIDYVHLSSPIGGGVQTGVQAAIAALVVSSPVLACFCAFGVRRFKPESWFLGAAWFGGWWVAGPAGSALLLPIAGVLVACALTPAASDAAVLRSPTWSWFLATGVGAACAFSGPSGRLAAVVVLLAAIGMLVFEKAVLSRALLVGGALAVAGVQFAGSAAAVVHAHARARTTLHALKSSGIWKNQLLYTNSSSLRCDDCEGGQRVVVLLDPNIASRVRRISEGPQGASLARAVSKSRVVLDFKGVPVDRGAIYAMTGEPRLVAWRRRLVENGAISTEVRGLTLYFWPESGRKLPSELPEL